ncbi:glycosyltransferase family protein [Arthrobacter sp. NPDC056493]|uniref:glycosyltransferase family protein n=1 Tax=Arthrobacter sp. NPDC056493 TaxID=3345839 RepID=UPI00366B7EC5
MKHLRIVLYSHDSLGLGHVRRNLALAGALSSQLPGLTGRHVTGILVAGTALAPGFRIPEGWDWVILPGVTKGAEGYEPRDLSVPMQDLVSLRGKLLDSLLQGFNPDLVIVDRHATGIQLELEGALRRLRARGKARVVLGLREVLDSPAAAIAEWDGIGGPRRVQELFDAVWIYGDRSVHDPVAAGEIPFSLRRMVSYTGYLAAGRPKGSGKLKIPGRYVMTTVGGGADGYALARLAAAAPLPPGLRHLIVAGPQMPKAQRRDLRRQAGPGVVIVKALEDMLAHISNAAAVVSMGGYNSVCEILSTAVPALVVPRDHSRGEQRIRAASLAAAGYLEQHELASLTSDALAAWLADRAGTRVDRRGAQLNGLSRVPGLAADLLKAPVLQAPDLLRPLSQQITSEPMISAQLNTLSQSLRGGAARAAV